MQLHKDIVCSQMNSIASSCLKQSCSSLSWRQQKLKAPPLVYCTEAPLPSQQLELLEERRESSGPSSALHEFPDRGSQALLGADPAGSCQAPPAQGGHHVPGQDSHAAPSVQCPVPLPCSEPTHSCLNDWTSSGCLPAMRPRCSWSTNPSSYKERFCLRSQAEPGEELTEIHLCAMEQLHQNNAFPILFDLDF